MASLEGFKNFTSGLAAVAVPVVVVWLGSYYTAAVKDREVSAKFVELAVGILSKEPSKTEADVGIRTWATRVIDQYSGVSFDQKTRDDIVNRIPLPGVVDTPLEGGSRQVIGVRQITRIIVRDTQQEDLQKELAGLQSGSVAYHYLIAQDGNIHRLKDEKEVAYHTTGFNDNSIGIGVMHVSGNGDYTQQQVASLSTLINDIAKRRQIAGQNINAASEVDPRRKSDFVKIKNQVLAGLAN